MQSNLPAFSAEIFPPGELEAVWEQVQQKYAEFLSDWRTDLGGKKNFHNGTGGTYDCIAIMSYYAVRRSVVSFCEIRVEQPAGAKPRKECPRLPKSQTSISICWSKTRNSRMSAR